MKIIVIGDPHFQTDNMTEVNLFVEKMEELVIKEIPNFIVILGDLLHTHERLHTTPLNKAYNFVKKMRDVSPTFILVGNHDMVNNQQFLSPNHWMNGMKEWDNVKIIDDVFHSKIEGFHFVFCPYVPPGRFQEALDTNQEDWKGVDCIFAHQEFYGCKMGAIVSIEGDKWSKEYPHVISGHIHSRQTVQNNIYYPGSSMQHAFGESEKNIIPILSWDKAGNPMSLIEIDLKLPRKKIVYMDVGDIEDYEPPKSKDKLKITLSGDYCDFKALKKTKKYKQLTDKGLKIVFKPKKIKKEEDDEKELEPVNETDFNRILSSLVAKEKDPFLYQIFELVINNKTINEDDILFL